MYIYTQCDKVMLDGIKLTQMKIFLKNNVVFLHRAKRKGLLKK